MRASSWAVAACLLLAPAAWAQDAAAPAPQQPQAKHHGAAKKTATPAAAPTAGDDEGIGTTLIGDRESPIGLYLTPWKNEYAERGMDRPAQFVQEQMAPVDPRVFARQLEYDDAIAEHRRIELGNKK